jgi:benzylsuccinate CoA-transferase BbsF subunit
VLTALHYRRRTGQGQYIDLSEQEAAVPVMGEALLEYQMTGRVPPRRGNRSRTAAPQGCYRCAGGDRWAVISCADDAEFARLARAIGHPDWAGDPRFSDLQGRQQHHDALDKAITAWTSQRSPYDVMHTLQAAGVKAAAVLDGHDALLDPHFRARGQYDRVEQPLLGPRLLPKHTAARFTRFDTAPRRPGPLLGEHNEEVLRELGYGDDEIAKLREDKVIAEAFGSPIPPALISAALKLPYDRYVEHGILQRIDADYKQQLGIEN